MSTPLAVDPVLRWVGGKRGLAREILAGVESFWGAAFLDGAVEYHEPFVGGAAVFFALRSRHGLEFRAHLSDRNPELANFYRELRDRPEELCAIASAWSVDLATFDRVCRDFPGFAPRSATRSAARTLYLNRTAFNGLYRLGPGGFNVPFGDRPPGFPVVDRPAIEAASIALRGTQISDCSFEDAPAPKPGDVVYFDPPYAKASLSSGSFANYDGEEFRFADHERLHDHALELASRGVRVVLSNSDTPWTRDLYSDAHVRLVSARRSIGTWSQKSEKRAGELLVFAGPGVEPGRSSDPFPELAAKRGSSFVRLDPAAVKARLSLHPEVRVEWLDPFGKWAIYPGRRLSIAEPVFVADDQLDDPVFVQRFRSRVLRTLL